jgi:hypothetical protein
MVGKVVLVNRHATRFRKGEERAGSIRRFNDHSAKKDAVIPDEDILEQSPGVMRFDQMGEKLNLNKITLQTRLFKNLTYYMLFLLL